METLCLNQQVIDMWKKKKKNGDWNVLIFQHGISKNGVWKKNFFCLADQVHDIGGPHWTTFPPFLSKQLSNQILTSCGCFPDKSTLTKNMFCPAG